MPPKHMNRIQNMSQQMIRNDRPLVDHYNHIDQIINLDYTLPEEIEDLKWMRKIVSTDPQSALKTARRTLATVEPIPTYQPTNPNQETKQNASRVEMSLLWQLRQANKRSRHDIVGDIVESALRYDKVVTQTVPLKWQVEGMKEMEGDMPSRMNAAKNYGDFMVIVHNPKNIHARWTPLGLDAVLAVKVMSAREAIGFYGEAANDLKRDVEKEDQEMFLTVFDWVDYDRRVTWGSSISREKIAADATEHEYTFIDKEMKVPFLAGWDIRVGGTSLEENEINAVRPMLGTVAKSRHWETMNIVKSIFGSEAIGYSAAPRYKISGPKSDEVRIDYGDINKPVRLNPGEDIEPLNPPPIDANLQNIHDRLQAEIDKDTVARFLQNLDFPSGTAFATVNAVIKSATAALDPYKGLAEEALSGVMENMLRWTQYTEEPLRGFGYHDEDKGTQYLLKPEHIDPQNIYIDVKLSAHVPTDYLQRIEAAIALNKQLEYPKDEAYKQLDEPNPDIIRDKWEQEQLDRHALELKMREMQANTDLKIQKQQMQLQMQAQQAMQARQAAQQQAQLGQRMNGGTSARGNMAAQLRQQLQQQQGAPRRESMSRASQGNPAQTGVSPNQSNPEGNLRERRTFRDREGEELA